MNSKNALVHRPNKDVYPVWDKAEQKFKNHYRTEELLNVLDLMFHTQLDLVASAGTEDVRIPVIQIARAITKMHTPPSPVITWCHRVIRIFYHEPLVDALKCGRVSARFALSDIANRLHEPRYQSIIEQACDGKITNAEFRKQIKLIRGTN